MAENTFKRGDVVALKSGGEVAAVGDKGWKVIPMTVGKLGVSFDGRTKVQDERAGEDTAGEDYDHVVCVFVHNGGFETIVLHQDTLEIYELDKFTVS